MAHDDDKPEAGDDPWAGLDAEGQADSGPDFTFSFDDDAAASTPAPDEPVADAPFFADPVAEEPLADELMAEEFAFGEPAAALDALLDDGLEAADSAALDSPPAPEASLPESLLPESLLEDDTAEPDVIPAADVFAGAAHEAAADVGAADADIDDWLNGAAEAEASASSVLAAGAFGDPGDEAGGFPDFAAGESTVSIGTGTSGVASPSGIDALGGGAAESESDEPGEEADPFAGLTTDEGEWPGVETPTAAGEAADDFGVGLDVGAGVAAAGAAAATVGSGDDGKRGAAKPKRPAAPRKKKPSVVGQLIGVVLGGAMAIPVTLGILVWGFGKDPFNLTPMLPDSVAFLLPAKFRPAGSDTIPNAPSLDAIVGTPAVDDGEAALPSAGDLATTEPEPPAPVEPDPTDLAAVDPAPAPGAGESQDDPLMNLLDESGGVTPPPAPVEPPPPPEPEPLDLEKLGATVAEATAALEAVAAVDDPSDPVRRRLTALWYKSLAGYAEELAALERLATETGRPFEPAIEQADAVRTGLADHPQLLAELSGLTRSWIAYGKRPSDGIVTSATFVGARRVGPYWRSQVSLAATDTKPALEMVVLTRSEPAVAPGDEVMITGLAVDDDVVWATELRPAAGGSGFPGL